MVAILLVVAAAYGIYALLSRTKPAPFQNFSVSKVTQTGKATLVAISPDGKYLLNVMDDGPAELVAAQRPDRQQYPGGGASAFALSWVCASLPTVILIFRSY